MRAFILISIIIGQVAGFLISKSSNGINLSTSFRYNMKFARVSELQSTETNEAPRWQIEGGDTSETECSSSGDIKRAADSAALAVELARVKAEDDAMKAKEDEGKRLAMAAEAASAEKAKKVPEIPKVAAAVAAPEEAGNSLIPKVDLSKLSVGTDSFDVGLLIAFPIIVATLGFFFLFPLIGPQLAATLPPVPKM
jgi:hypothetical protein